jgi:hypothetical protein
MVLLASVVREWRHAHGADARLSHYFVPCCKGSMAAEVRSQADYAINAGPNDFIASKDLFIASKKSQDL